MQIHCALLSCQTIQISSVFSKFYRNASFSLLLLENARQKSIFKLVLLIGLFFCIFLECTFRNFCIWRNTFIPVLHQLWTLWVLYRCVFKITHNSLTLLSNVIIVFIRTFINQSNTEATVSSKSYLAQFSFSFSLLYTW